MKKAKKITGLVTLGFGIMSAISVGVSLVSVSLYYNDYYNAQGDAKSSGEGLVYYAEENNLSPNTVNSSPATESYTYNGNTGTTSASLWAAQLGQGYHSGVNASEIADGDSIYIESGSSLKTFDKIVDSDGNVSYDEKGTQVAGVATPTNTSDDVFQYDVVAYTSLTSSSKFGTVGIPSLTPLPSSEGPVFLLPEVVEAYDAGEPIGNPDVRGGLNNDTNHDGFENILDLANVANIPEFVLDSNKGEEFVITVEAHTYTYDEAMVWNEYMYDGLDVNLYASTEAYYQLRIPAFVTAIATTLITGVGLLSLFGLAMYDSIKNKEVEN